MKFDLTEQHLATIEARRATAKEWFAAKSIEDFYATSEALPQEIAAWHEEAGRKRITDFLVDVAKQTERKYVVDIGCGLGHDLDALFDAGLTCFGVEPNYQMRVMERRFPVEDCIENAPLEEADLIVLMDVLEHIENPETLVDAIAERVKPGTILVEHTPTWDMSDVLHLTENYGWTMADHSDGWIRLNPPESEVGIWQRVSVQSP